MNANENNLSMLGYLNVTKYESVLKWMSSGCWFRHVNGMCGR